MAQDYTGTECPKCNKPKAMEKTISDLTFSSKELNKKEPKPGDLAKSAIKELKEELEKMKEDYSTELYTNDSDQ